MKKLLQLTIPLIVVVANCHAGEGDWKLQPLRYNQSDLAVDLGVGLWAWPMPVDYDNDGDIDLLVACPDKPSNGVYYFENPTQDPKKQDARISPWCSRR